MWWVDVKIRGVIYVRWGGPFNSAAEAKSYCAQKRFKPVRVYQKWVE